MARRILYVEGEKDADALWALGIPATTHIGGAKAFEPWGRDYVMQLFLAGAETIVVVPDQDPAGWQMMQEVARACLEIHLRVQWLTLPDVPDKGDVSDWLNGWVDGQGVAHPPHTKEELHALIDGAPFVTAESLPAWGADAAGLPLDAVATPGDRDGAPEDPAAPETGPYGISEGCLCLVKPGEEGGKPRVEKLCNFRAWIAEEQQRDNGQETAYHFLMRGRLASGEALREFPLPAERFRSLAWITSEWGARPLIKAGAAKADQVRAAIQFCSDPTHRLVFTHTGWRQFDGVWRYLSGDGAVGTEGVQVDLGRDLARYRLPLRPVDVKLAMRESLKTLELGPLNLTVPLWCAVYRAVIAEVLQVDFTLWMAGRSGVQKSSLAAVFMGHYGDFTDKTSLNLGWSSSENYLEDLTFRLKDSVCPLDDFVAGPENRAQHDKAARMVRAQGNLAGRGRMSVDLVARPSRAPRGLLLVTGETYPLGESVFARTFTLEVESGMVDLAALSEAQKAESLFRLPHAMAGYLSWLAPMMRNGLAKEVGEYFRLTRTRLQTAGQHLRVPEIIAQLAVGQHFALLFAQEIGAVSEAQAWQLEEQGLEALKQVGAQQGRMVEERRPTRLFLEVLQGLLLERRFCLLPRHKAPEEHKGPPMPLGWFDPVYLYLIPGTAVGEVMRASREQGIPFPIEAARLLKELAEDGLVAHDREHRTYPATVGKKQQRVLRLSRPALDRMLDSVFVVPDDPPDPAATGYTGGSTTRDEESGAAQADEPQNRFRGF